MKCWETLYWEIKVEEKAHQSLGGDYASTFIDEAIGFFEDIGSLLQSEYTVGECTNGLAVYLLFMESFGKYEGRAAVLEHMTLLGIPPALTMRCDFL